MIARAVKRYERLSPTKARRILRIIKGKDIPTARALLSFHHSRSKIPILKTLNSAVSNFKNQVGKVRVDDKDLYVKEAIAQDGPQMKRWRPGFRGTADLIRRRTCHIKIAVDSFKPIILKKGE
ncbi:MAG: 50S ribosomal protein L22 [candidate division WOR-3 bacterium]